MRSFVTVSALVLCVSVFTSAQGNPQCVSLVQQALGQVDTACEQIGRNQLCYGNALLDVTLREEDPDVPFAEPGDFAELIAVEAVSVGPMITPDQWGIAVVSLQANLPGALPGQNVTMVLIGDVTMIDSSSDVPEVAMPEGASDDFIYSSMQAITLRTGIGRPQCAEAPPDGVLIQTLGGSARVNLLVNRMQVELGSTIYMRAMWDDRMVLATLEGSARLTVGDTAVEIPAGSMAEVPLDADGAPSGEPQVTSIDATEYAALMPFLQDILPEPVDAIAGTGAQAAPQVNEGSGQTTFEVTTTNFESEVLNSDQPVLVDFSAEWCGPCRAIAPIVDELATEYTGTMKVGKLDIDQQTDLAVRYDITSIPTLILFKGGEPVARIIGQRPKDEIVSELVPHLD